MILLYNALIYDTCRAGGALLIDNERIAAVGERATVEATAARLRSAPDTIERIDVGGRLVLPGLINAHHHLYSALAAGLAPRGSMDTFPHILQNVWWPLDAAHDQESVYACAIVGLLDALAHGCTTVVDHHASMSFVRGSLDTVARAFQEAGVRGVLCFETSERTGPAGLEQHIEENLAFARAHSAHPMLRGLFGLHANTTLSRNALERIARAKPRELPVHVHVGESHDDLDFCRADGFAGPIHRLHSFGLVDQNSFLAHGIHLDQVDTEILGRLEPNLISNPESNANNGVGRFDSRRNHGYLLGTDGMSNDMIATLRYHYLALQEARISTAHLPEVASVYPARALGQFFPGVGTLIAGAPADVAVLDYVPLTPIHAQNAFAHLVYGARSARAFLTIVDGQVRFRAGHYPHLDPAQLRQAARVAAQHLHARFYGQS